MINLFYDEHDAEWEAWIDVEDDPKNGVCLGSGPTKTAALFKASVSLRYELKSVYEMMRNQDDACQPTIRSFEVKKKHFQDTWSKPKQDAQGIRNLATTFRNLKAWAKALDPRYYRKITKKEHDDLLAQIDWVSRRLENWPNYE